MNKFAKGAIATGAAMVLLMGGAGSLAYWNASSSFSAGSISSGSLTITPGTGSWNNSIAKIVPGDSRTYTKTFTITAVGDNLHANVSTNIDAITNGITGATANTTFVLVDSLSAPVTPTAGVYAIAEGTYTLTATITVNFPTSATAGQNGTLNLNNVAVTVQQV